MKTLKLWASRLAFPLFILTLAALTVIFHREIWDLFENRAHLRQMILEAGIWGPLIFIALQILQVAVAFIPGELTQLAGGWIFGTFLGTVYSVVGITIGSVFNFYIARFLGIRFVEAVAGKSNLEKFEKFLNTPRVFEIFFLLFLIPGMVKDVLTYFAGLTRMKLWGFLLISTLGRLPALTVSSYMGEKAGEGDWLSLGIVGGVATLLFVLGWFQRERVQGFLSSMVGKAPGSQDS